MSYITPAELAERPGARELAQIASAEHQAVVEPALMDATLRGTDRSAWTPEQLTIADAALARINEAVAEASAVIDGYLAQRGYTLPLALSPTGSAFKLLGSWARSITRYMLHKSRVSDDSKDPIARDYRDALKALGLLAQGKFSLGADDPVSSNTAGASTDVRFDGAPTVFGRRELRAFR